MFKRIEKMGEREIIRFIPGIDIGNAVTIMERLQSVKKYKNINQIENSNAGQEKDIGSQ